LAELVKMRMQQVLNGMNSRGNACHNIKR